MGLMSSINVDDDDKTTVKSTGSLGAFDTKPKEEIKEEPTLPISLFSGSPVSTLYDVQGTQVPAGVIIEAGEGIKTGAKVGLPSIPSNLISFGNFLNDLIADYGQYAGMPGVNAALYAKSLQPHFNKFEKTYGREAFNNMIVNSEFEAIGNRTLGEIFDITEEDLKNPATLVGEILVTMPLTSLDKGQNLTSFKKPIDWKEFGRRVNDHFNNLKYADSPEFATETASNTSAITSPNTSLINQSSRLFNMSDEAAQGTGGANITILNAKSDPTGSFTVSAKVLENAKSINSRGISQINTSPFLTKNVLKAIQEGTSNTSKKLITDFINMDKYSLKYASLPENTAELKRKNLQGTNPTLNDFITDLQDYIQPMKPTIGDFQTSLSKSLAYGAGNTDNTIEAITQSNFVLSNNKFEEYHVTYNQGAEAMPGMFYKENSDNIQNVKYLHKDIYSTQGVRIPFSSFATTVKPVGGTGTEANFPIQAEYYKHPEIFGPGRINPSYVDPFLGNQPKVAGKKEYSYVEPDTSGFRIGHYRGHDNIVVNPALPAPSHAVDFLKHFNFDTERFLDYKQDLYGASNLKDPVGFLQYYKMVYGKDTFNKEVPPTWNQKGTQVFGTLNVFRLNSFKGIESSMTEKVTNILDTFDVPMPIFNPERVNSTLKQAETTQQLKTTGMTKVANLLEYDTSPEFASRLGNLIGDDIETSISMQDKFKDYAKTVLSDDEFKILESFLKSTVPSDEKTATSTFGSLNLVDLPPMLPVTKKLTSEKYKEILKLAKEEYNQESAILLAEVHSYIANWMKNYANSSVGGDVIRNAGKTGLKDKSSSWIANNKVLDKYNMSKSGWRGAPHLLAMRVEDKNAKLQDRAPYLLYPHQYFNDNQVNRSVTQYSGKDLEQAARTDRETRTALEGGGANVATGKTIKLGENFQQGILDYIDKSTARAKTYADYYANYSDYYTTSQVQHLDKVFSEANFSKEQIRDIMIKLTPELKKANLQKVISLMKKDKEINKKMFSNIKSRTASLLQGSSIDKRTGLVKPEANEKLLTPMDAELQKQLGTNYHEIASDFEEKILKWESLGGKDIFRIDDKPEDLNDKPFTGLVLNEGNKIVVGENQSAAMQKALRNWGDTSRIIVEIQDDPLKPDQNSKWKNAIRAAQSAIVGDSPEKQLAFFVKLMESGWANGQPENIVNFLTSGGRLSDFPEEAKKITQYLRNLPINDFGRTPLTQEQLELAIASIKYKEGVTNDVDVNKLTAAERYYASLTQSSEKQMRANILAILEKAEEDNIKEVLLPDAGTAAKIQNWKSDVTAAERASLFEQEYKLAPFPVKSLFNSTSHLEKAAFVPHISATNTLVRNYADAQIHLPSIFPLTVVDGARTLVPENTLFKSLLKRHIYYMEGSRTSTISADGRAIYAPFEMNNTNSPIENLVNNSMYQKSYSDAVEKWENVSTVLIDKPNPNSTQKVPVEVRPIFPYQLYMQDRQIYDQDFMGDGEKFLIELMGKGFKDKGKGLENLNDTFVQPVLLDMAYLIKNGYISKEARGYAVGAPMVDFDMLKNTVLPSNYYLTKSNFMASTKLKEDAFLDIKEELQSPSMIMTIMQLYDKTIADKLLTTIFSDELTRKYTMFGKSSIDKDKLYDIIEQKLTAPFENAMSSFKIGLKTTMSNKYPPPGKYQLGKYFASDIIHLSKLPPSFAANTVTSGTKLKYRNILVEGKNILTNEIFRNNNKDVFMPPSKNWSVDIDDDTGNPINLDEMVKLNRYDALLMKASFIDSVIAEAKVAYNEKPPPSFFNDFFMKTKKYGKVSSTYGKDIPNALTNMKIPFTVTQESTVPSTYDYFRRMKRYINPTGRFFKINVKNAKKALKENAPQLFGFGAMLGGAGYAADRISSEREEDPTIPLL